MSERRDFSLIILGNAGSGKTFLCNTLLGKSQFEEGFSPESVTKATEKFSTNISEVQLTIYNIPGLLESDQTAIDNNKQEIHRAFALGAYSVVFFVWTHVGGRVQNDDVIAFQALQKAYRFPPESLAFIVNQVPDDRPAKFDSEFVASLSVKLQCDLDPKKFVFINTIYKKQSAEKLKEERDKVRNQLWVMISNQRAEEQVRHAEIHLQQDELEELRTQKDNLLADAEKNREEFENRIRSLDERLTESKKELEEAMKKANGLTWMDVVGAFIPPVGIVHALIQASKQKS